MRVPKGRAPAPRPARALHHSRPTLHPPQETHTLFIVTSAVAIICGLAVIAAALILPLL